MAHTFTVCMIRTVRITAKIRKTNIISGLTWRSVPWSGLAWRSVPWSGLACPSVLWCTLRYYLYDTTCTIDERRKTIELNVSTFEAFVGSFYCHKRDGDDKEDQKNKKSCEKKSFNLPPNIAKAKQMNETHCPMQV